MEHIGPFTQQYPRDMNLLAQRVVGRRLEDGAEVRPERRRDSEVGLRAQEDVLALLVEPRQVPQQVADVRADAEVVELPRIDRDSHSVQNTCSSQEAEGGRRPRAFRYARSHGAQRGWCFS